MSRPISPTTQPQLLRLPDVRRKTGLSRSSIYRRVADGTFPAPVKIGERSSAWSSEEVDGWIASVIATRSQSSPK
jgi:prophage regulatory protein